MISYLIGIVYFFVIFQMFLVLQSFLYARRERNAKRPDYTPKVVVIAPHYGWDAQTEQNVRYLLEQDYTGDYEIFFVTHAKGESGFDVSYPHLTKIAVEHPHARVFLAPNIIDNSLPRSQKVQNLMTAIAEMSDDVEVIAFVDADATIQKDWLTRLIQPLQGKHWGNGRREILPSSRFECCVAGRGDLGKFPDRIAGRPPTYDGLGRV